MSTALSAAKMYAPASIYEVADHNSQLDMAELKSGSVLATY